MAEKLVIQVVTEDKQLDSTIDKMAQLGQVDKKNADQFKKTNKQTQDEIKKTNKETSSLSSSMGSLGATIAGAFAVQQIIAFGNEARKLAGQVEGVRKAFDKLDRPDLLKNLRLATRNTVNDLELMKAAVRAQNFKVPLEKLATFFEFATKRANQTGESVDYLVNSIIDGIGRKSSLVLDNLGISATELQAEIKKTGDFGKAAGNIIEREIGKAGDVMATSAETSAAFAASVDNMKIAVGNLINQAIDPLINDDGMLMGLVKLVTAAATGFKDMSGDVDDANDSLKAFNLTVAQGLEIERAMIIGQIEAIERAGGSSALVGLREKLAGINEALKEEVTALTTELLDQAVAGEVDAAKVDLLRDKTIQLTKAQNDLRDSIKQVNFERLTPIDAGKLDTINAVDPDVNVEDLYYQNEYGMSKKEYDKQQKAAADLQAQNKQAVADASLAIAQTATSTIFALQNTRLQKETTEELKKIDKLAAAGRISDEEAQNRKQNIQRQEALRAQTNAEFAAVINGALAITKTFAEYGFTPAGVIAAAAQAVATAGQIALIESQPLPGFKDGVVQLRGDGTETSDSILARLSKNESVITAKGTRQDPDLFRAANAGTLQEYINKTYVYPAIVKSTLEDKRNSDLAERIADSLSLQAIYSDKGVIRGLEQVRKTSEKNTEILYAALNQPRDLRNK